MRKPRGAVHVREATPNDAAAACAAVRRSIVEICGPDYGHEEPVMSDWLKSMTKENFLGWIEAGEDCCLVAVDVMASADVVVGFSRMGRNGWVHLCYVVPEALKQGYGKAMLQALEAQAIEWGVEAMRLHSSITAKAFYEGNGFALCGEPKLYGSTLGDFPLLKELRCSRSGS